MLNMNTLDYLQHNFSALMERIDRLGEKVDRISSSAYDERDHQWLNVADLQAYLPSHPKRQTIYSWTSTRQIPFHKKGRSIMFDKNEIDAWLQDSEHIKSLSDLEREANDFVKTKHLKTK